MMNTKAPILVIENGVFFCRWIHESNTIKTRSKYGIEKDGTEKNGKKEDQTL